MRIGADIGGTFTDLVMSDVDGQLTIHKLLTTPTKPDDAVMTGSTTLGGANLSGLDHLIHGTTLFTNALIERKGARTALITTLGFRDAIEIGREHRYDMYDLYMQRPAPIAPRYLRFEVIERMRVDGGVHTPLDEASLEPILQALVTERVEAVAVSLLHAYANPAHEQRIGEILRARLPDLAVTLSSELVPEIREYERSSTALANVYVQRTAELYLNRLRERLDQAGHQGDLFIMQSNGGVCDIETATRFPIRLVESGPAAGALAAAHYGQSLGIHDLLSFDMGGTTAKACVITGGKPQISPEFEVDRQYQFKKGSGLPVKVPVIEMIEIGTGGGSLAAIDRLGRLQVGPQSAGASPGPAAYGQGGRDPTVTDADLILGYLDPDFFLGGTMQLDLVAARAAIIEQVAKPLGLDLLKAAYGIHQLANETMASAARIHAIERGLNIARLPVFAYGGAGPVHAHGVARILRSPSVIYPLCAGVMSAIGFLTAPLAIDLVRSRPGPFEAYDWPEAQAAIAEMKAEGRATLGRSTPATSLVFSLVADMRYRKQGYEIRVAVPTMEIGPEQADALRIAFETSYAAVYGHTVPDTPIDIVSWRLTVSGPKPDFRPPTHHATDSQPLKGYREAYLPKIGKMGKIPIYDRYALAPQTELEGPAIIEERESTVVINDKATCRVDHHGNLIVDMEG